MIMFNSNEPVKVDQLQKVENQSMSNGARVIEMVSNSFNESKKTLVV